MRYWVIAPYDSTKKDIWEKVWEFDLSNNTIAIGWNKLGNISSYNEEKLREVIQEKYSDKNKAWKTWSFNSMWNFWQNIKVGDTIVARKGTKCIAGVGIVTQTAFYDKELGYKRVGEITNDFYSNFIGVQWNESPRDLEFKDIVFSILTIYEIDKTKYDNLINGEPREKQFEFILEKYLENFIVSNFDKIFKGKLKLYEPPDIAQQYDTSEVGIIDILAEEPETNSIVIIELKKGRESDKVIGQTLRYMGWVDENIREKNQKVKAIIICMEADQKLKYALKMTNNIELKYYEVDFKLNDH